MNKDGFNQLHLSLCHTVELTKKVRCNLHFHLKKRTPNCPLNQFPGCLIWTAAKTLDAEDNCLPVLVPLTLH